MIRVSYSSNNSGGDWWLEDEDWQNLEEAGWEVEWYKGSSFTEGDRFLGALASNASKEFDSIESGIAEWEEITGKDSMAGGCECCGPPHYFYDY